ncbi:MAG TPA: flagellar export protein FliJ [Caulobacteraceae bacterium]|nr:flagellar export protein FliJ [Caulobacteraceae bacterium]
MSWQDSLIRISNHEIEGLQKRLAEVVERRTDAEMRLVILEAETEVEIVRADQDAQAGWYRAGFLQAVRGRRATLQGEIGKLIAEEAGARDALQEAFEALKKFEHVAELSRMAAAKAEARREAVILDDLGLRKRLR